MRLSSIHWSDTPGIALISTYISRAPAAREGAVYGCSKAQSDAINVYWNADDDLELSRSTRLTCHQITQCKEIEDDIGIDAVMLFSFSEVGDGIERSARATYKWFRLLGDLMRYPLSSVWLPTADDYRGGKLSVRFMKVRSVQGDRIRLMVAVVVKRSDGSLLLIHRNR